jgi:hypothetical protein
LELTLDLLELSLQELSVFLHHLELELLDLGELVLMRLLLSVDRIAQHDNQYDLYSDNEPMNLYHIIPLFLEDLVGG